MAMEMSVLEALALSKFADVAQLSPGDTESESDFKSGTFRDASSRG